MRSLLRPILLPLLRRDPGEITRRARAFRIRHERGRSLVDQLGAAFISGYNAMLRSDSLEEVAAEGRLVRPHYRPFFFEGAAMGYLPRGYLRPGVAPRDAERHLLEMEPGYRYLYYVGLGFWIGMRHPNRPSALEALARHVDPIYSPLCYDGFGFKVGFYDHPGPKVMKRLRACPPGQSAFVHQGFGRALFFHYMDDEDGFQELRSGFTPDRRADLDFGRSLGVAFTGVDRPLDVVGHIRAAGEEAERGARLAGVTWALTAREMNDPEYYRRCLSQAPPGVRDFLDRLPGECHAALEVSSSYGEWQKRTEERAIRLYETARSALSP